MTVPENFVSRWVRLKREVASARKTESVAEAPQHATAVMPEVGLYPSQHRDDAAIDEAFDLASLPSIESIAAETDIRAFLHSSVPAELTRLALRRAWASDPAIRDFIGIAENQWDFNDPDAMPGFGPLRASDNLPGPLQQALGNGERLAEETLAALPAPREQGQSPVPNREPDDLDRSAERRLDAAPAAGPDLGGLVVGGDTEGITVSRDRAVEANDGMPNQRSHGSALPRFKV
ncbi:DUF3306 domain-containing protein [Bradyrhizobium cenepequi]|uniref:DUF3306 domain-containing protein n=1 Tax=Bradyrhizobium cenepequi TaxID=2821403 RepID=UPI001CE2AB2E|nr:DUF3306 domain-containing protein [Bradyrhizobium cenepequi]MCA6109383.1 DUF3306 domain-containing protein [Bradyrhizobium cenepequi]